MKIEFNDLALLNAIYQYGSFAKAAEKIHRSRSAVSQKIQKLEHQLGYKIFDRQTPKPQFTPKGQFLLEKGWHIIKQMEQLSGAMALIEEGFETEFSIAYDDILSCDGILSLIKDFQTAISSSISIKLHREVLNGTWDALVQNRAMLAIGAAGEPPLNLACKQKNLGSTQFVFAMAPSHPLAMIKNPLSQQDIAAACSIVISDTSQQLTQRSVGTIAGQTIVCVPNMDAKIQAQMQGIGVGYLPKHRILHHLANGALIEGNTLCARSKSYLKIAWRSDVNSKILTWFLEHLGKEEVRDRLLMA